MQLPGDSRQGIPGDFTFFKGLTGDFVRESRLGVFGICVDNGTIRSRVSRNLLCFDDESTTTGHTFFPKLCINNRAISPAEYVYLK